jgi:uncharacterized Zn-binding protein involved in type VI secretion
MGNPAARVGDTANTCNDPADMPVGTVVAVGTVLINGIPAAKQGDQIVGVDTHIVLVPSPGGPIPTPMPHPFNGIINGGLSSSVKIMGMPAATVQSTADNTPPHIFMPPGTSFQKPPTNKAQIIMGSPNVMIGNGGGGGGGGGGGKSSAQAASQSIEQKEGHFIHAKYVDKGGKPITGVGYKIKGPDGKKRQGTLTGEIKQMGVPEGSYEIKICNITQAKWSVKNATVGDKVKLLVETVGVDSGEKAELQIFIKDSGFTDRLFETIKTEIKSDKIEEEWEFKVDDKLFKDQDGKKGKGYSNPYYYFVVYTAGLKQRSGFLRYRDWIELELKDENGKTIGGAEYTLHLQNGQIIKGKLDNNGYAKVENIPPGKVKVTYDVRKSNSN